MGDQKTSDTLIAEVIKREGGFVNNASDYGGATKYGITKATLAEYRGNPVSVQDVANLTQDEAAAIYKRNYFTRPGLDKVTDGPIREFMFDFCVHAGVGGAVMCLQRILGCTPDGAIGPVSGAALKREIERNAEALYYRIKAERLEALLRQTSNPSQSIFASGWANRLDHFEYK